MSRQGKTKKILSSHHAHKIMRNIYTAFYKGGSVTLRSAIPTLFDLEFQLGI